MFAEFEVLFFNTVENKSSEWGTSPPLWYFTTAIPKALLGTVLFLPLGLVELAPTVTTGFKPNSWTLQYALPALAFVVLYSFLPHKELRFILPAMPIFNVIAAEGLGGVWRLYGVVFHGSDKRTKKATATFKLLVRIFSALLLAGSALLLVATAAGTALFLTASSSNYPGGVAFQRLHEIIPATNSDVHVLIKNAAAMSGVTRFGEQRADWTYSKEGYEDENQIGQDVGAFTHVITDDKASCENWGGEWRVLEEVESFQRVDWRRLAVVKEANMFILEKVVG